MNGPKKEISAGEVNRYAYCPYQWYYTKIYGDKELRARYRELHPNEASAGISRFARGRDFHENFGKHEKLKRYLAIGLTVILTTGLLAVLAYIVKWPL